MTGLEYDRKVRQVGDVIDRLTSEGKAVATAGGGTHPVFLDDYQLPAVNRAAAFWSANLDWKLEEVSRPDDLHQWAVLRTGAAPDERPFDYYIDF